MILGLHTIKNNEIKPTLWKTSDYTYSEVGFIYITFSVNSENTIQLSLKLFNSLSEYENNNPILILNMGEYQIDLSSNLFITNVINIAQTEIFNKYNVQTTTF